MFENINIAKNINTGIKKDIDIDIAKSILKNIDMDIVGLENFENINSAKKTLKNIDITIFPSINSKISEKMPIYVEKITTP